MCCPAPNHSPRPVLEFWVFGARFAGGILAERMEAAEVPLPSCYNKMSIHLPGCGAMSLPANPVPLVAARGRGRTTRGVASCGTDVNTRPNLHWTPGRIHVYCAHTYIYIYVYIYIYISAGPVRGHQADCLHGRYGSGLRESPIKLS